MIEFEGILSPDVVCVCGESYPNDLYSTEFHINLYRPQINLFGQQLNQTDEELQILVTCNSTPCPNVLAMLNKDRVVEFIESNGQKTIQPSSEILKQLSLLRGRNTVIFESKILQIKAECSVYLWNYSDKIVVVDIDGTLTRSDVRGYVETVYLGRYDYVHDGAVTFFSTLEKEYSVCHLYLTSRPLHHLEDTKAFLRLVRDRKGHNLPIGPLFTNKENVMRAIYRELVAKTTAQFKGSVLIDILSLFVLAGAEHTPYCLGVGNKETDALAYRMAGLNSSRILLVQSNSTIIVSVAMTQTLSFPNDNNNSNNNNIEEISSKQSTESRLTLSLFGNSNISTNSNLDNNSNTNNNSKKKLNENELDTNYIETPRTNLTFTTYSDPTLWQYVRLKMDRNCPAKSSRLRNNTQTNNEIYSPRLLKSITEEERLSTSTDSIARDSDSLRPTLSESSSSSSLSSSNSSSSNSLNSLSNLPQQLRLSRGRSAGSYIREIPEIPPPQLPPVDFHQTEVFESIYSPKKVSSSSSSSSTSSNSLTSSTTSNSKSKKSTEVPQRQMISTISRKKLTDMTDFFNPIESADI